jgi:hypothetical protein
MEIPHTSFLFVKITRGGGGMKIGREKKEN